MAEGTRIDESEDFSESPPEEKTSPSSAGREISIVLAGKRKAGKSSLARNILGVEQVKKTSAKPETEECNTQAATKNGVTLRVTDTVGLIGGQIERSKEIG